MITVVKDITDTYKVYWNGVSNVAGSSVAGSIDTGLNVDSFSQTIYNFSFSQYQSGSTSNTHSISLYQVYNRELTRAEILQNYNTIRTRYNL